MKFLPNLCTLSLSLLLSTSAAISYDGWKVLRIETPAGQRDEVSQKLSSISFDEWNNVPGQDITIAVSEDQLANLEPLGLQYQVLHEDLDLSIASESRPAAVKWKRQADDLSWFESYHSYEEHKEYFEALHSAFPNNSEIVSTGTSYEGRDIWGIHFWGAKGPGQPAVIWHGTVHAREWIASMVRLQPTEGTYFVG